MGVLGVSLWNYGLAWPRVVFHFCVLSFAFGRGRRTLFFGQAVATEIAQNEPVIRRRARLARWFCFRFVC